MIPCPLPQAQYILARNAYHEYEILEVESQQGKVSIPTREASYSLVFSINDSIIGIVPFLFISKVANYLL